MRGVFSRGRPVVLLGYRRILVPVAVGRELGRVIDVACRLAAERDASITALAVLEIPPLLPLDVHLPDEEDEARGLLERVERTADRFDVRVSAEVLRARDAAAAVVRRATEDEVEAIVMGNSGARPRAGQAVVLGPTVEHVLRDAPCRVLVISSRPEARADQKGDTETPVQAA